MKRIIFSISCISIFFSVCTLLLLGCDKKNDRRQYRVGQVWSLDGAKGDSAAQITIMQIDVPQTDHEATVIHVCVSGISLRCPLVADKQVNTISSLALTSKALDQTALTLMKQESQTPNYTQAYERWKQARDSGEHGIAIEIEEEGRPASLFYLGEVFESPVDKVISQIADILLKKQ